MSGKTKSGFGKYVVCILFAVILTATVSSFGMVFARYAKQHESGQGVVTSQNMYFRSDYLSEQGEAYTISDKSVTFCLMNYPDALRVSEIDVTYTVTVTPVTDPNEQIELSSAGGKFTASKQESVKIHLSGLKSGHTYIVTAVGENGYKTTLSATFTVKAEEKQVFKRVEQTEYYVLLTVWTQDVNGEAVITFPNKLLPDNTDPQLKGVTAAEENFVDKDSFDLSYSSRTYRFFKQANDTTVYTADNFIVKVGNTNAEVETTN